MRRKSEARPQSGPEWAQAWRFHMHYILREALRVLPEPLLPTPSVYDPVDRKRTKNNIDRNYITFLRATNGSEESDG